MKVLVTLNKSKPNTDNIRGVTLDVVSLTTVLSTKLSFVFGIS